MSCTGSESREGQGLPTRDSPSSHRLQHSHSDLSPHHSLASASMSPVFEQYLQQQAQAPGLPQTQSRHSRSVTADQLSWPRGGVRGQDGGAGRRSDWAGMGIPPSSELDLTFSRLRVDAGSQVCLSALHIAGATLIICSPQKSPNCGTSFAIQQNTRLMQKG